MDYENLLVNHELFEGKRLEAMMISPIADDLGVIILSEDAGSEVYVRVYRIEKTSEERYEIVGELEAFAFKNRESATSFISHLPNMSAIELMFAMNSTPQYIV